MSAKRGNINRQHATSHWLLNLVKAGIWCYLERLVTVIPPADLYPLIFVDASIRSEDTATHLT